MYFFIVFNSIIDIFTNSERMEELKGVIKRRQELINEQDEVIKLMRYVNQHQATGDGNEQIKDMIKEVFLKYDDISRQVQQSEVIYNFTTNLSNR